MNIFSILSKIKTLTPTKHMIGIPQNLLEPFANNHELLQACNKALTNYNSTRELYPKLYQTDESQQTKILQNNFINFYHPESLNPYTPIAAHGPWIITSYGSVLYDTGGYGMLGFGHSPSNTQQAVSSEYVMANIMTPSFYQYEFADKLKKEIGYTRKNKPWHKTLKFICLNSGSEGMTLALRLSDAYALTTQTSKKKPLFIALKSGFHGRTDLPSQISHSCLKKYQEQLLSFRHRENTIFVEANNIDELEKAFVKADQENSFIQALAMEPVMGEGQPGLQISPNFYKRARELTTINKSIFIVDSIQAGLRAQGCLSIVDYPGFGELSPPDIEVYSKALNAGQFPLSVIAVFKDSAIFQKSGIYGNTMTANPKALAVGSAVLDSINTNLRDNIKNKGEELLAMGERLQKKYPQLIREVKGTGLLFSLEMNPKKITVVNNKGLEKTLRKSGLGIIHGGENALRMTPWFAINSKEIGLLEQLLGSALQQIT